MTLFLESPAAAMESFVDFGGGEFGGNFWINCKLAGADWSLWARSGDVGLHLRRPPAEGRCGLMNENECRKLFTTRYTLIEWQCPFMILLVSIRSMLCIIMGVASSP